MKNFIKANLKVLPTFILFSAISVYAAGALNSHDVGYCPGNENIEAATVGDALDLLYARVDNVPIGTIMSYMGTTAPDNYLICDGSIYNIEDYPKLAEHIKNDFGSYNKFGGNGETTFAVPDLRGEFLRGAGTATRNTGTGAAVGTHQNATELPHFRVYVQNDNKISIQAFSPYPNTGNFVDFSNTDKRIDTSTPNEHQWTDVIDNNSASAHTGNWNGTYKYTTRPTNTSVNYLIKAN